MPQSMGTSGVSRSSRRRPVLVGISVLIIGALGVSLYLFLTRNENGRSENLPFRSIAQGPKPGDSGLTQYTSNEPVLFIAARLEEVNDLSPWLLPQEPQAVEQLRQISYDHEFAVLVMHGDVGSDGYGIAVQQVQRSDSIITIQANFITPKPGIVEEMFVDSPYHLIAVSKEGTWGGQFRLVLMNGSTPVAETTHFIP